MEALKENIDQKQSDYESLESSINALKQERDREIQNMYDKIEIIKQDAMTEHETLTDLYAR